MYRILCVQHTKWIFKFTFVLALYPLIYSIRGRYRKEWKKSREKELITLTGLRETVTGGKRVPQRERSPGERYHQVGGEEREKGGGSVGQCVPGAQGGAHSTGGEMGSHWKAGWGARRGAGGGGQLSHWCPGHSDGVFTPCLRERAGSRRIWSLKMYNIENCKICLQF